MSESTTMPREHGEFLIAIGPAGAHLILGVRGGLARDVAGEPLAAGRNILSAWLGGGLDGLAPGLWAWEGSLSPGPADSRWWLRFAATDATIRPAVAADMQRFGLEPLLPRIPEGSEAVRC